VADGLRFGFERMANGRGILVHHWSVATSAKERPLEIMADTDAIWPTLDRRHIALRRAHEQTLCDIHSLASGARIATLEKPVDIAVLRTRTFALTGPGDAAPSRDHQPPGAWLAPPADRQSSPSYQASRLAVSPKPTQVRASM